MTEGAVRAGDRRALFVGIAAYEAAGGIVLRDLFADDDGGWLQDAGLLDRLANWRSCKPKPSSCAPTAGSGSRSGSTFHMATPTGCAA